MFANGWCINLADSVGVSFSKSWQNIMTKSYKGVNRWKENNFNYF